MPIRRLSRYALVESDERRREPLANDPACPVKVRAPTALGVAAGKVELHHRAGSLPPVGTLIVRLEEGRVKREVTPIIVDDRVSIGREGFDSSHLAAVPCRELEEYTPWIVTRQSRPPGQVSSRDNLARNLKVLRQSRGLSQEALADAAGIDRSYVSALERQKYSLSIDRLDSLASSLGVEPFVLLMSELPSNAG